MVGGRSEGERMVGRGSKEERMVGMEGVNDGEEGRE